MCWYVLKPGAGIACWLEQRTRDRKVASSNPGRSGGKIISPESALRADSYSVSVPPRVTAVVRKRPRSFRQKRRWQTHTPLTQRSRSGLTMPLSGHSVGTLSGNELTCNSSGNTQSQSSQLAEPLWTNPGVKRGISMRKLISNKKRKKKSAGGE